MARIEKTVFISYRRTDVFTALAVYENLKNQGYDVFFDYRTIPSGDFEQYIIASIKARAHFLVILTPTALDRCNESGDWLRREIELAMDEKRNIVPLFFKGFRFGTPAVKEKLTGKLKNISRYNGLNVHEDYFEEAMQRVRAQFLSKPLDTVLHPVSTEVQKVVEEEKNAADEAIKQKIVGRNVLNRSIRKSWILLNPRIRQFVVVASILFLVPLCIMGGLNYIGDNLFDFVTATATLETAQATKPINTITPSPTKTTVPPASTPTETAVPPTPTPKLGIGSTMTGKDGMTLLYVPAGEFTMGSDDGNDSEKPAHIVYIEAFWIDQTEVANFMFVKFLNNMVSQVSVEEGGDVTLGEYNIYDLTCGECPNWTDRIKWDGNSFLVESGYENHPVTFVSWYGAGSYCSWVDRHLPTESEWEKAARGENAFIYPWGDKQPDNSLLNYNRVINDTTEIGNYPAGASPYGALDMAGNVWEWVDDWYDAYPGSTMSTSNYGTTYRVARGGAWNKNDFVVRSTIRSGYIPVATSYEVGFRCAMDAQ